MRPDYARKLFDDQRRRYIFLLISPGYRLAVLQLEEFSAP